MTIRPGAPWVCKGSSVSPPLAQTQSRIRSHGYDPIPSSDPSVHVPDYSRLHPQYRSWPMRRFIRLNRSSGSDARVSSAACGSRFPLSMALGKTQGCALIPALHNTNCLPLFKLTLYLRTRRAMSERREFENRQGDFASVARRSGRKSADLADAAGWSISA